MTFIKARLASLCSWQKSLPIGCLNTLDRYGQKIARLEEISTCN